VDSSPPPSHLNREARFPRLASYIAALPEGLDSYPDCKSKGSLVRSALDGHDPDELLPGLLPELATLVLRPPVAGFWVPAVLADAMFYAVCDRYYPTRDAMCAWTRRRVFAMGASPLYGAMLRAAGPRRLFSYAQKSHRIFQRGTECVNASLDHTHVVARLAFPPHLHTYFNLLSNVAMYETLAEITGGKEVRATLAKWDATSAVYECHWT